MKIVVLILAVVGFAFVNASAQPNRELKRETASATSGSRTALVIGNGAYADAPLKNPPNDANDIAAALKTLGFEVMSFTNLDQTAMKRSIREFGTKLPQLLATTREWASTLRPDALAVVDRDQRVVRVLAPVLAADPPRNRGLTINSGSKVATRRAAFSRVTAPIR